jgi:predicted RND superfamily exporter protein
MTATPAQFPLGHRIAGFIQEHPIRSVALGVFLLAFMIAGLTRVEPDFTHRGYFHENDPLLTKFEAFERRFGNDDAIVVAIHSPSGLFDADSIGLLHELTRKMWLVPEVIRVDSLTNYPWVHAVDDEIVVEPFIQEEETLSETFLQQRRRVALSHDTLPGYLIDAQGRTALVFGQVRPALGNEPDVAAITRAVRELTRELTRGDHQFHIAGSPAMVTAFTEVAESDNVRVIPLAFLACCVILGLTLRSVASVLMSLLVVIGSAFASIGITGWLGIEISSITAALPQIMLAIAMADSVHVLSTFSGARRRMEPGDAARYALAKNFIPTLFTSATTAAGFVSFAASPIKPIAGLGLAASVTTMAAWCFTYLIVGGLLFLVPVPAKRPARERPVASDRGARIGDFFSRRGPAILIGFGVLTFFSLLLSMKNRVDADPVKYFAATHPLRVAFDFISNTVGATRTVELVVDSGQAEGAMDPDFLARVDELELWVERLPRVTRAVSILDSLKQTHRALNGDRPENYLLSSDREALAQELLLYTMSLPEAMNEQNRITLNRDALRITVLWTVGNSTEAIAAMDRMERKGRDLGLAVTATGKYQLFQRLEGYVVDSFLSSVVISLILVVGQMMLCFRSIRLGLLALIPNVVPLLMGGALLWLIGETLNIGTVLVVSVCLGIAVDDTVHFLSEYQRLVKSGATNEQALGGVFEHTAPSLIATTAALVVTFGVFVLSTFTPYQVFGVMTASIMIIGLVIELALLPALLLSRGVIRMVGFKRPAYSLPVASAGEDG